MKPPKIKWLPEPEAHDYPAAGDYLLLLHPAGMVAVWVRDLMAAPMIKAKAKDIFRASGLSLLGVSNSHVKKDRKKIKDGEALSPLLLVRQQGKLLVADGYHRLCAVYAFSEDAEIPCKLV